MPDELAAEVRGLRHTYAGGATALAGLDLDVERGRVTALLGANGSGKTTLLRVLAGTLEPSAGEVRLLGSTRPWRGGRSLRRRLGYVAQDPALDPEMTGREVLLLLAALYGLDRAERPRRTAELGEAFGISAELERRIDTYSGGQRRRLHLAAGMIHDPELLCLDEPSAGLDADGRDVLWQEITRRAENGRAIAIVSHDLGAVERHAHTVQILERGRVVAAGRPRDLVAEHPGGLAAAYRHHTGREPDIARPRQKSGRGRKRGSSPC